MSSPEKNPTKSVERKPSQMLGKSPFDTEATGQLMAAPPFQLKASPERENPPIQQKQNSGGLPGNLVNGFGATSGHDLSDVNVHYNSDKPAQVGALAYAQGNDIHLGAGQEQHLAHEAAHIVQQREGRVQANANVNGMPVNNENGLEKQADTMGAEAEKVSTASAPAQKKTASGNTVQRKQANGSVKQLYKAYNNAGETDPKTGIHWASNGTPLRVAEDGTAAVAQADGAGGQELYVEAGRLPGINADLKKVKAPLVFAKRGARTVEGAAPGNLSGAKKKLVQVKPVDPANPARVKNIPDDCGDAARTVTGAFAQGKNLKAKYKDSAGKAQTAKSNDPEMMKYEIFVNHFSAQIPDSAKVLADIGAKITAKDGLSTKLEPHFEKITVQATALDTLRRNFDTTWQGVKDKVAAYEADKAKIATDDPNIATKMAAIDAEIKKEKDKFETYRRRFAVEEAAIIKKWRAILAKKIGTKTVEQLIDEYSDTIKEYEALKATIMKPYNDQPIADKEKFDEKVGINRFANPNVGEAYTMSSGGKDYAGENTWNFHWGGVVFKSTTGSDNITMENYAGSRDSDWRLQMYGIPSLGNERKGQTFHEQHEATHQHGDNPTTLAAEKK